MVVLWHLGSGCPHPLLTLPRPPPLALAELFKVGQPEMALETLHDILTSKRHRTWSPVHEKIMMKYIDLCIQLQL